MSVFLNAALKRKLPDRISPNLQQTYGLGVRSSKLHSDSSIKWSRRLVRQQADQGMQGRRPSRGLVSMRFDLILIN